ncbi:MAG: (d)CMP kinase [Candidatus Omnitrophota bacterium]|nr:(d)CMP kinase [Candidatus Omnitrophota bacterium]MBU2529333.1 (d)CMP kinase [bacterium]MBU3930291.1 (d)CMP kinase [bacterium]MBU4123177.1 (d)CMP kinase [bacterium]MDO9513905.1 (d)CMP kinase [Elusimicrobiota bacterium]
MKVITIDGPAGAGKSTIAKIAAAKLGFTYIDTGAMYRAVTYKVLKNGCDFSDTEKIIGLAGQSEIRLDNGKIFLDGEDVTDKIRTRQVTNKTSIIAALGEVRKILREKQRVFSKAQNLVMEGRDIGSVVFPDAEYKFYLDASISERARRRWAELREKGAEVKMEEIVEDINQRDNLDLNRGLCPLIIPKGAFVIDSTNKSIEEVANIIVTHAGK